MHGIYLISPAINALNVIMLVALLYIFSKNYRHIRSKYNLGLVLFSSLFLAENLLMLHLGVFSWPFCAADEVMLHIVVINTIQLLGLLSLLYITWK